MANLVKAQCLTIRFQGFLIVFLALLYETEDMPADMRRQVEPDTLLDEFQTFFPLAHVGEDQPFHAYCLCAAPRTLDHSHGKANDNVPPCSGNFFNI